MELMLELSSAVVAFSKDTSESSAPFTRCHDPEDACGASLAQAVVVLVLRLVLHSMSQSSRVPTFFRKECADCAEVFYRRNSLVRHCRESGHRPTLPFDDSLMH